MHDRIQKTTNNKNKPLAEKTAGLRGDGGAVFVVEDNRAASVAQVKLQEMANNSFRVKRLKSIQKMANESSGKYGGARFEILARTRDAFAMQARGTKKRGKLQNERSDFSGKPALKPNLCASARTVQRIVDWSGESMKKTQGGNYGVNDNKTLYSKADAAPPEPPGLYAKGVDKTSDEMPVSLNAWKPNVKFLSAWFIDYGHEQTEEEKSVLEKSKTGGLRPDIKGSPPSVVFEELSREFERITGEVKIAMSAPVKKGAVAPAMGIVGRNDCAQWAKTLQMLIYKGRSGIIEEKKSANFDLGEDEKANLKGAPQVHVGDEMEQTLGSGSGSDHHGATVVARDGASLVTLEAHVEKAIPAPEFHIRAGLSGFVDANNMGENGEKDKYLSANKRQGRISTLGDALQGISGREEMLEFYESQLNSSDSEDKLKGIRGVLTWYQESKSESKQSRGKCFLTTACVQSMGLSDDCEELTVLRAFRDGHMQSLPAGRALIREYYQIAPGIVAAINEDSNRTRIYDDLYATIRSCVQAIGRGEHSVALQRYKSMVLTLAHRYGNSRA